MFRTQRAFCLAFALLAMLATLPAAADRPVDERIDADPRGVVEIENVSGSVVVRGWDRDEVVVEGAVGDDVEALRVTSHGGRTVVKVELPEGRHDRWRDRDYDADLEIRVPASSAVETSTVSASQRIADIDGALDLRTVSGGIDVSGRPESLELETVSGAAEVDAETDSLRASTVSGTLVLRGRARDIKANAVSGTIKLGTHGAERLDVQTVSSNITVDLDLAATASIRASSHSGSLTLRLDPSVSAEISASSWSGRIRNELGPAPETRRHGPGSDLSFTLGRGDGRIKLSTFSGSVRIESR